MKETTEEWREKGIDLVEQFFPKLNSEDTTKKSPNHRSEAITLFGMLTVLHESLMGKTMQSKGETMQETTMTNQSFIEKRLAEFDEEFPSPDGQDFIGMERISNLKRFLSESMSQAVEEERGKIVKDSVEDMKEHYKTLQ